MESNNVTPQDELLRAVEAMCERFLLTEEQENHILDVLNLPPRSTRY